MTQPLRMAVIGGSGLYQIPGLRHTEEMHIDTPFGSPSAPILTGQLGGSRIAFLARHGWNHTLNPSEINYRANIFALKKLGVERVFSVTACGSLREDYQPGEIVIPDQLFDFTKHRASTFFEGGLAAHVGTAEPFCPRQNTTTAEAVEAVGGKVHRGGAFLIIEGPRFSTRLESHTFRSWGMSLIGMTAAPEAFLAREAEMCYTSLAHITDFDVWHIRDEPVSAAMVSRTLEQNIKTIHNIIEHLAANLTQLPSDPERTCPCASALQSAFLTPRDSIPEAARQKLLPLISRYL